jgi:hypothetical protein
MMKSTQSFETSRQLGEEVFMIKTVDMRFNNKDCMLVATQDLSQFVVYEKTKMLAHFYEMITTTFSHELQTPLHQQVTLTDTVLKII